MAFEKAKLVSKKGPTGGNTGVAKGSGRLRKGEWQGEQEGVAG